MGNSLEARRRHLASRGRPMQLRRQTAVTPLAYATVTVQGFKRDYTPGQVVGEIQQGDARVEILPDEIEATGWPGPPRPKDAVLIDGAVWTVQGAPALYDGPVLVGYSLWIRGAK